MCFVLVTETVIDRFLFLTVLQSKIKKFVIGKSINRMPSYKVVKIYEYVY